MKAPNKHAHNRQEEKQEERIAFQPLAACEFMLKLP